MAHLIPAQFTKFLENISFRNTFSSGIASIATQSDGKILVGGAFTNYGPAGRSSAVRLNVDGNVDTAFCVNAADVNKFNTNVISTAIQPDGKMLVGGAFTNYSGTTGRNRLVRLNSDGTVDTAFCLNATDGTKFNGGVFSIATQPDGKILVGGSFIDYAGTTGRSRLIRLNSDGTLDTAFCVNAADGGKFGGAISSIAVQPDGKIVVGGAFANYAGTTGRSRLVRLNSDGTLDTAFCVNAVDGGKFGSAINAVTVQSDGKILVGGASTNYAGTANRNRIVRLNSDGTLDTVFTDNASTPPKGSGLCNAMVMQSDGKILVGGAFTNYAGTTGRSYVVRLNSDGTLDTAFCVNAVDGGKFGSAINAVTVQSDGKILVGGSFIDYAGTTGRSRLVRLNSDGTLDTAFCVNAADGNKFPIGAVTGMAIQSNDKILLYGTFTNSILFANRYCTGMKRINTYGLSI